MGVFVIEIQDNTLTPYYYSQQEYETGVAEQKFYTICASASVSNVAHHVVVMMSNDGSVLKEETFNHQTNQ